MGVALLRSKGLRAVCLIAPILPCILQSDVRIVLAGLNGQTVGRLLFFSGLKNLRVPRSQRLRRARDLSWLRYSPVELENVVHIARVVLSLQVVWRGGVLTSTVDDKLELLPNLDVKGNRINLSVLLILLTSDFKTPGTVTALPTEFAKDLNFRNLTQIKAPCVKEELRSMNTELFCPESQAHSAEVALKSKRICKKNLPKLLFIGLVDPAA